MKISYSWLKEHIPLEVSAKDLAGHLLSLGFEVSEIARQGAGFTGVVAGKILEVAKHPNADRLSLCRVSDGKDIFSIICGGANLAVDQVIPLARIGAQLPGGAITRAKIRGVESQGMICSGDELGLPVERDGKIMVLDPKTEVGSDIADSFGSGDEVLDVDITPNRPDCLSHLGLARELSAYFQIPLKPRNAESFVVSGKCFPVDIRESEACSRYLGRMITDLKVAPSPGWLVLKLKAVGLRPVNNIVDLTNFILMDIGHPMHAFDADTLEGGKIVVRFAAKGEKIRALDGKEYALTPECLVIADAKRPQAIAGVMGGEESSVTKKTRRIFLECAHFDPATIRRTGTILRLRSDSSYRFERGTDIGALGPASLQASALIMKFCATAKVSKSVDEGLPVEPPDIISTTPERINAILGSSFPKENIRKVLSSIGTVTGDDEYRFLPPTHRLDLRTPWDLAEETARIIGYSQITPKLPVGSLRPSKEIRTHTVADRCRGRLASVGLMEAYNYDFLSEGQLSRARLPAGGTARLSNPISEDWTILRPTLLVGLLQNAATNLNVGETSVRLFEVGRTYRLEKDGSLSEKTRVAGILVGPSTRAHWKNSRPAATDFCEIKGIVEDLLDCDPLESCSKNEPARSRRSGQKFKWEKLKTPGDFASPIFHPGQSQQISCPGGLLGLVGTLHPQTARAWDLQDVPAAAFELDLDALSDLPAPTLKFTPFSVLPYSWRDISFLVDKKVPFEDIYAAALRSGGEALHTVDLNDVYADEKKLPEGKHSLNMRITFESKGKTIKDEEVSAGMERILAELKKSFGVELRS